MDEKLRRWLESRCQMRPDGTWRVEVPVTQAMPAPAFVLPDEATKEDFLARAVRLGRLRLLSEFVVLLLFYAVVVWFNMAVVLDHQDGLGSWLAAILAALVLVALRYVWLRREIRQLHGWLDRAGDDAAAEFGRIEDGEQEAGWWSGWRAEIKRCRPGWMVLADAVANSAFLVSFVLFNSVQSAHCRQALKAWRGAEASLWPVPDGCLNLGTAISLCLAVWWAAGPALAVGDWWRWNRT